MDIASPARDALDRLTAGNGRFVRRTGTTPDMSAPPRAQHPHTIVLGCSDSRVPVETIFDQTPGEIFVVRNAGNVVDDNALGSIEYSVAVLDSSLILVLGHSHCGAVTATLEYVRDGTEQPGHIQGLVAAIAPSARAARDVPGDWMKNAVVANIRASMAEIAVRSSIISDAIAHGRLAIAGGVYDLSSGEVQLLA